MKGHLFNTIFDIHSNNIPVPFELTTFNYIDSI